MYKHLEFLFLIDICMQKMCRLNFLKFFQDCLWDKVGWEGVGEMKSGDLEAKQKEKVKTHAK